MTKRIKKTTVEYRTHLSMFITFMRFAWRLTSKMPTAFCFNCLKGLKMQASDVETTDPSHPSLYLVKCGNAATQKITSVAPSSRSKRKGCNADSQAFLDSSAIFRVKLWPMGDICEADSCGLNSVWDQKDARWKGLESRLAYTRRWWMNCVTTVRCTCASHTHRCKHNATWSQIQCEAILFVLNSHKPGGWKNSFSYIAVSCWRRQLKGLYMLGLAVKPIWQCEWNPKK